MNGISVSFEPRRLGGGKDGQVGSSEVVRDDNGCGFIIVTLGMGGTAAGVPEYGVIVGKEEHPWKKTEGLRLSEEERTRLLRPDGEGK